MATIFLVDFPQGGESERKIRYAEIQLDRWGERQGGAAFVSVDNRFVITDYAYDHKELQLLRHILNCNNLSYRAIANVDLYKLGESEFARAIISQNNKKQEH